MAVTKVVMPKLSDTMESGKIIKWLKKEGDRVQGGDILAEVETDKADIEMEAYGSGVVRKILTPEGQVAPVGTLIAVIAEEREDISALLAGKVLAAAAPFTMTNADLERAKVILVAGILNDKDLKGMAAALGPLAARVYACRPKSHRAFEAEEVVLAFQPYAEAATIPAVGGAIDAAISSARPEDVVLITGSIYTAGEALDHLGVRP